MEIKISDRLNTIANQVKYRTMADIGTDHAYIPIYLCQNGTIDYAIASDINKGPLKKADENIKKYMLEDKISLVLGNGLEKINFSEIKKIAPLAFGIETVVIAGMGGNLIIDILNNNLETVKQLKQLVLQPQLDIYEVRKYIHSIGFSIENEQMIIEEGKYYNIISATIGNEKYYNDQHYRWGKILIEKKDKTLKQYVSITLEKYNIIIKDLNNKNTIATINRKEKLLDEIKLLVEVLKWL